MNLKSALTINNNTAEKRDGYHGNTFTFMYVCMYVCMYVWMDGWMDGCVQLGINRFLIGLNLNLNVS